MILLLDIGNTHTHLGLANGKRVLRQSDIATTAWANGAASAVRLAMSANSSSGVPVTSRILAMLSVLGQRGRPSCVKRFERLKAVGSSPASRARADGDRWRRAAIASIACQIQSWVSVGGERRMASRLSERCAHNPFGFAAAGCNSRDPAACSIGHAHVPPMQTMGRAA